MRDAREDWRRLDAQKIPSKASTPQLDRVLAAVQETAPENRPLALLDVGCGTGRLGRRLYDRGFSVLGVDVNPDAVRTAQDLAVSAAAPDRSLRFVEGDFAADHAARIDGGPFDVVVCQLVLSIIGDVRRRSNRAVPGVDSIPSGPAGCSKDGWVHDGRVARRSRLRASLSRSSPHWLPACGSDG